MGQGLSDLCPPDEQRRELDTLLRAMPDLAQLAHRQPGEPERPRVFYASTETKHGTYPMVHIPVFGRPGTLWVGRSPGFGGLDSMQDEVDALYEFGIRRVVCLVPEPSLANTPDCANYGKSAREKFREGFRSVPVADFGTPADDAMFEQELASVDNALRVGTPTLVHCMAGCGRTGMFVSCLLVRTGQAPQTAIRTFRRVRGCGPETAQQVAYVFRYARRLGEGVCR